MSRRVAAFAVTVAWMALAACAMTPVLGPQDSARRVEVSAGDQLRVLTLDGRRRAVTVVGADATGLVTSQERIPYDDLVFVERAQANAAAIVGGVLLVTLLSAAQAGGYSAILAAGAPQ